MFDPLPFFIRGIGMSLSPFLSFSPTHFFLMSLSGPFTNAINKAKKPSASFIWGPATCSHKVKTVRHILSL